MSKILRKNMKIFGSNPGFNQMAVFGSLAAGVPSFSTDPEVIQSLSNYLDGWFDAVIGNNSPAIEDMNSLCFVYAYQIAYLMQAGIAEWNTDTTYYVGSMVNDGNGRIYTSLTDNNTGNPITDVINWQLNGTPIGSILPYGSSVQPSGFLFCDGTSQSIATYSDLWNYIGNNYGTADGATTTGDTVINTNTVNVASTTGMNLGDFFRAEKDGVLIFPSGTTITNISVLTVTVSNNAVASKTGAIVHTGLHFNVPYGNGQFLRGTDNGAGVDPDAALRTALQPGGNTGDLVGSAQADGFASHNHNSIGASSYNGQTGGAGPVVQANIGPTGTSFTGGNETRPKNIYVNYIIKT